MTISTLAPHCRHSANISEKRDVTIDLHHLRHSSHQLCHAYRTFHLDTLPGGPDNGPLTDTLPATSSHLPSLHTLARQLDHLGSSPVGLTALADWHLRETHCLMMALDHTSTAICHTEDDIRDVLTRTYHYYARENDHHLPTFAGCTQGGHPSPTPEVLGRPLRDVAAAFLDLDRHTFCPHIRTWQGSAATLGTLAYGIHMAATGVRLADIPGTYTFTLGLHMHRWADSLALLAHHAEQVALRLSHFASTCLRARTALADAAMQQRLDEALPALGTAGRIAPHGYTQQADAILTDIYNPGLEATSLGDCGAPMPIRTLCLPGCQDAVLEWPATPIYQPELVIPEMFALPDNAGGHYAALPQRTSVEHRYGDGGHLGANAVEYDNRRDSGDGDSVSSDSATAPTPVLNPQEIFRPLDDLTASTYWMRLGNGF